MRAHVKRELCLNITTPFRVRILEHPNWRKFDHGVNYGAENKGHKEWRSRPLYKKTRLNRAIASWNHDPV